MVGELGTSPSSLRQNPRDFVQRHFEEVSAGGLLLVGSGSVHQSSSKAGELQELGSVGGVKWG